MVNTLDSLAVSLQLLGYAIHAYSALMLQHTIIASHASTAMFLHRLLGAVELDTGHPLLRSALKEVARGHAGGTQQRLRRPVSWAVLRGGADLVSQWGTGRRVSFWR